MPLLLWGADWTPRAVASLAPGSHGSNSLCDRAQKHLGCGRWMELAGNMTDMVILIWFLSDGLPLRAFPMVSGARGGGGVMLKKTSQWFWGPIPSNEAFYRSKGGTAWAPRFPMRWHDTARLWGGLYYHCWLCPAGLMMALCLEGQGHFQPKKETHWASEWKQMLKDNKAFYYESITSLKCP